MQKKKRGKSLVSVYADVPRYHLFFKPFVDVLKIFREVDDYFLKDGQPRLLVHAQNFVKRPVNRVIFWMQISKMRTPEDKYICQTPIKFRKAIFVDGQFLNFVLEIR